MYDWDDKTLALMHNPDVSVRSRGVMEKCSYCNQRIQAVKIEADKENREIRDGEIKTACQQACPTNAIIFGNINDRNAEVSEDQDEHADLWGTGRHQYASAHHVCGGRAEH